MCPARRTDRPAAPPSRSPPPQPANPHRPDRGHPPTAATTGGTPPIPTARLTGPPRVTPQPRRPPADPERPASKDADHDKPLRPQIFPSSAPHGAVRNRIDPAHQRPGAPCRGRRGTHVMTPASEPKCIGPRRGPPGSASSRTDAIGTGSASPTPGWALTGFSPRAATLGHHPAPVAPRKVGVPPAAMPGSAVTVPTRPGRRTPDDRHIEGNCPDVGSDRVGDTR